MLTRRRWTGTTYVLKSENTQRKQVLSLIYKTKSKFFYIKYSGVYPFNTAKHIKTASKVWNCRGSRRPQNTERLRSPLR